MHMLHRTHLLHDEGISGARSDVDGVAVEHHGGCGNVLEVVGRVAVLLVNCDHRGPQSGGVGELLAVYSVSYGIGQG